MKALSLDATHRQYLTDRQAICIDLNGDETLVGLTPSESVTYLYLLDQTLSNDWPEDIGTLTNFLSMHDRHTAALEEWTLKYPIAFRFEEFAH